MKERFAEFTTSVTTAYKKLQQIKKKQAEAYAAYDIRAPHVMCLYFLGHRPEGATVTELATLCCEDKAATSRAIDYLVEKGYCVHEEDEARKRWRSKVKITPEGEEVTKTIDYVILRASATVTAGIPREDLRVFYRVFAQMIKNMDNVQ